MFYCHLKYIHLYIVVIDNIFLLFYHKQASQNQQSPKAGNGKTDGENGATQSNTQVSNSVIPGPQSANHVVVDEKKKKKCTCCVIQ